MCASRPRHRSCTMAATRRDSSPGGGKKAASGGSSTTRSKTTSSPVPSPPACPAGEFPRRATRASSRSVSFHRHPTSTRAYHVGTGTRAPARRVTRARLWACSASSATTRTVTRDAPRASSELRVRDTVVAGGVARILSRSVSPNGGARPAARSSSRGDRASASSRDAIPASASRAATARGTNCDRGVGVSSHRRAASEDASLAAAKHAEKHPSAGTPRRANVANAANAEAGARAMNRSTSKRARSGASHKTSEASDMHACARTKSFSRGARIAVATTGAGARAFAFRFAFAFAFLALPSCMTGNRAAVRFHSRRSFFSFRRSATSPTNSSRPQRRNKTSRVVAGTGAASRNERIVASVARASSIAAPSAAGTKRRFLTSSSSAFSTSAPSSVRVRVAS